MAFNIGHSWLDQKPPLGSLIDPDHPQNLGVKLWHLLNENDGPPFDLAGTAGLATVVGAPSWQSTVAGIGWGGCSAGNYAAIPNAAPILGVVYPFWTAFCVVNSGTGYQVLGGAGSTVGTATQSVFLDLNHNSAAGTINYFLRDDTHGGGGVGAYATGINCNDGNPHVIAGVSYSPSSHAILWDGKTVGTSTGTLGTTTCNQYLLGVNPTALNTPLSSGRLIWHKVGNGSVPDFAWLAAEPYAGILPPATRRAYFYGSTATVYTGSGGSSLSSLSPSTSALYLPPSYSAAGTPTVSNPTVAAVASYSPPNTSGSGSVTLASVTVASASASYAPPASVPGSGSVTLANLTASGTATYSVPVWSGTGTVTLANLTAAGTGTSTVPGWSGSGAVTLANLAAAAVASYAGPGVYSATGSPTLADLTATGTGTVTIPNLSGSGAPSLASLTVVASATYTGLGTPYRDRDAYNAILSLLVGTGEFDRVVFGPSSERDNLGGSVRRTCLVTPTRQPGFTQRNDGSPGRKYREVGYTVTLKVIEENQEDAYALIDRLDAVIHNTLEAVSYGGFTISWKSILKSGLVDDRRRPEYRMTITGIFAYVVESHVGFSVTA